MNHPMETIYNWLLQNMGNEGNAYTILNCRRIQRVEGGEYIHVMARSEDFTVVNLIIVNTQLTEAEITTLTEGSDDVDSHMLGNPNDVLDYLRTGKLINAPASAQNDALYLLKFKPAGVTGELTFPPEQSN